MTPTPPPRPPRVQPSPKVTVIHASPPTPAPITPLRRAQKTQAQKPTQTQKLSQSEKLALIKSELQKRGYQVLKVEGNKVIAKTKRPATISAPKGMPMPDILDNMKYVGERGQSEVFQGLADVEVEFQILDNGKSIRLIPTKTTSGDIQTIDTLFSKQPPAPSQANTSPSSPSPSKSRKVPRLVELPLPDAMWQERRPPNSPTPQPVDMTGYDEYYRGMYVAEELLKEGKYLGTQQNEYSSWRQVGHDLVEGIEGDLSSTWDRLKNWLWGKGEDQVEVEWKGKKYNVTLLRNEIVFVNPFVSEVGIGRVLSEVEGKRLLGAVSAIFGIAAYKVWKREHHPKQQAGEVDLPLPDYARKFGENDDENYREWSPSINAENYITTRKVKVEMKVSDAQLNSPRTANINIPRVRTRVEDKSAPITINADAYLPGEVNINRNPCPETGIFPTEILNRLGGRYEHSDVNIDEEISIDLPGAGYAYVNRVNRYEYRTRNRFRFRPPFRFGFDFPNVNISPPRLSTRRGRRKRTRSEVLGELDLFAQGILDLEGVEVAKISTGKFRRLYSSGNALWKEDLSLLSSPPRRGRKKTRKERKGKNKRGGKKKNRRNRGWSLL